MIKQHISRLLDAEMDRKDFMKLLGFGIIAATGVGSVVKSITTHTASHIASTQQQQAANYYSSSVYGA